MPPDQERAWPVVRRIAICARCATLTHSGRVPSWPRLCRRCGHPLPVTSLPPVALSGARQRAAGRTWWTRERVLAGLRRFHQDRGLAPVSSGEWHRLTARRGGHGGGPGTHRPYPSLHGVLRYFASFRQAWAAAGIDVGRCEEAWAETDDWYLREGAGLISRVELARDLQRTPDAVHRRLYDLGLNSYQRWGWTLHRIERVAQVPRHVLQTYMDRGDLPYLRGSKVLFVDPADLIVVREINWKHPPVEFEEATRHAWRVRLVKVLAGLDWRVGRPHRSQPIHRTDRRWGPRLACPGPKPVELVAADRVRVVGAVPSRPHCLGRVGVVRLVYWSFTHNPIGPASSRNGWRAWNSRAKVRAASSPASRTRCRWPTSSEWPVRSL